jgi:hypothetical protein
MLPVFLVLHPSLHTTIPAALYIWREEERREREREREREINISAYLF